MRSSRPASPLKETIPTQPSARCPFCRWILKRTRLISGKIFMEKQRNNQGHKWPRSYNPIRRKRTPEVELWQESFFVCFYAYIFGKLKSSILNVVSLFNTMHKFCWHSINDKIQYAHKYHAERRRNEKNTKKHTKHHLFLYGHVSDVFHGADAGTGVGDLCISFRCVGRRDFCVRFGCTGRRDFRISFGCTGVTGDGKCVP